MIIASHSEVGAFHSRCGVESGVGRPTGPRIVEESVKSDGKWDGDCESADRESAIHRPGIS